MPRPKSGEKVSQLAIVIYKHQEQLFERIFKIAAEANVKSKTKAVVYALENAVDYLESSGDERMRAEIQRQLEEAEAQAKALRERLEGAANDNEPDTVIPEAFKRNKKKEKETA